VKPKFYQVLSWVAAYTLALVVCVYVAEQLLAFVDTPTRSHLRISIPLGMFFGGIFIFLSWNGVLDEFIRRRRRWNIIEEWPGEEPRPSVDRGTELPAIAHAKSALPQPLRAPAKMHWAKLNFFAAVFLIFAWAICAWRMGIPLDKEFLGSPWVDGPAWLDTLVGETLVVIWIFQRDRRALLLLRSVVAIAGLHGIYMVALTNVIHLPFEKCLAGYVWLSHLALAIFWPFRANGAQRQWTD
jgi:hypothetical protein